MAAGKERQLSPEAIRERYVYDAEAGCLRRRHTTPGIGRAAGSVVGKDDGAGYLRTVVGGRSYRVHRLIWAHVHGVWPSRSIDHINGIRTDNRIENLRDVGHQTNLENQRHARADNARSDQLGVTFHKATGRWRARITTDGKQKHLGLFDDAEGAHLAYLAAKRAIHGGCTL